MSNNAFEFKSLEGFSNNVSACVFQLKKIKIYCVNGVGRKVAAAGNLKLQPTATHTQSSAILDLFISLLGGMGCC